MTLKLTKTTKIPQDKNLVLIACDNSKFEDYSLSYEEISYLKSVFKKEIKLASINRLNRWIFVQLIEKDDNKAFQKENMRKAANSLHSKIVELKLEDVVIVDVDNNPDDVLAFAEGFALSNYQFLEYFQDKEKKSNSIKSIEIFSEKINEKDVDGLDIIVDSIAVTKDLVNQPLSFLNAEQLAKEAMILGKKAGFSVKVFDKKEIEKLGMGGLLAVNKGSIDPPTFSILEWKPEKKKNSKPIVLVGKGIVYDTGGLSLKPTPNSMDMMKCDMAGAAAVLGTVYAVAKSNLPVHVIGLLPATDNRPDGNAYAPGDVIKMHNGLNVEVLNTDAEGRMILADALSYAKKYDPELVIDVATLTGAAEIAIGKYGIVAMGTAERKYFDCLDKAGVDVFERIVEFPFWKEYAELIKSDIADIKNLGGRNGGAITAGKFLERFTDYPWIHLDIAGTAFLTAVDSYRGKGATGSGVRLLFELIKSYEV